MKTRQEIFDIVSRHLLSQGIKSIDMSGTCLYRGPNGLKCAVGCLIPDDLYRQQLEMQGVDACDVLYVLEDVEICERDDENMIRFLRDLQNLHDGTVPAFWREELNQLANRWGIRPTE
jgi:hypothetical protein